jgi:superfamily II DNA or RNA helicase
MKPRYSTLGDSIYHKIEDNQYLNELYETLLFNYSMKLMGYTKRNKPLKKDDLLRFADILSKSYGNENSEKQRSWAQEIVALLNAIDPEDAKVKAYATSILANIGNYRGLQLIKTKYRSTSFLDELYSQFDLDYLAIPHQKDKYFFHQQKEIYEHLEDNSFSYSGPTSMGKSLLMRMFIKDKILNGFKGNFAILIPTKALISEISSGIINDDLKDELAKQNFKVVTSGNSLFFKQENLNFIMVMTPERMLYTLISYPSLSIDYLFIDEAHKMSEADGRSTFYFKVTDMLSQRDRKPHIILASPNIPNPDVYLTALPKDQQEDSGSLRTTFSPVSQMKYILDMKKLDFTVFNEHKKGKDPFVRVFGLSPQDTTSDLIRKIILKDESKSNIIYCSGRERTVKAARDYADTISKCPNDPELDKLSQEIKDEIHSDYFLADLIRKGVAYHVGYLPMHIRTRIEDLYRDRKIKTLFCTSTLIEGVNLPADNLIVISCRIGHKGNMNAVEFKNLLGRVGRIEYNLYGNVFIIRDKNMSEKTIKDLLTKDVPDQRISLSSSLSWEEKRYLVAQFSNGDTQISPMEGQQPEQYDLMRKTGLILLKDIISGRDSVVKAQFDGLLSPKIAQRIKSNFTKKSPESPQPDDDINVSLDQTENLINAINAGLEYPPLVNNRVDYYKLKDFLYKLLKVFKWRIYEQETLGSGNKIDYYAVILSRWMNGYGLNLLLKDTLDNNRDNHREVLTSFGHYEPYNGSQEHKNIVIGDTLQIIESVILFSIANYFLRFSTEYKKIKNNGQPFDNDWYEYVEYGSTNPLTIFFQRNGLSRETADYIRQHQEYLSLPTDGYRLKKTLLNCQKESVVDEIKNILFNVPELFID